MRKSLGRLIVIFLMVFSLNLSASTYKWNAYINKESAFVNEAVLLKYVCEFDDRSELYTIDFNPVTDNENYTIKPLSEQEQIVDGKRVNSFEYIAYVKRSGEMVFDFDIHMKKTNKASIENTVLGRDNEQYEEFTSTYLKQKSLYVNIKDSGTDLVGEFTLEVKKDEAKVNSFEAYNLDLTIKGVGNFENLKPIEFKIDGVKVFSQKAILKSLLKEDGEHATWSQKFAFVSDKNFSIPVMEFEYFDIKKASVQKLRFSGVEVEVVSEYRKEELLDEEPKGFEFNREYLYYFLTFVLGFVVAKIKFRKTKHKQTKEEFFCDKVQSAKSLEELSVTLAIESSSKYEKILLEIEKEELTSLEDAKKLICS